MNEKSKEFVHGKLILENNVFKNCYGETHDIHLEYLEKAEIMYLIRLLQSPQIVLVKLLKKTI